MKRYLVIYLAVGLTALLSSCGDKNAFVLSGTLTNAGSLKKVYLLAADSSQIAVVDSTNLSDQHKFEFKHASPYANLYKLRIGGSIFDFIAKNGDDIAFSTNVTDTAHAYQISGSPESDKIKEFNRISNQFGAVSSKLSQEYQDKSQAIGKQSDSLVQAFMPRFNAMIGDYSSAVLKFVNANKNSLAGFYAATSLDAGRYEPQLIAYANAIKGSFKDNPTVQRFIKQEMIAEPLSIGHPAPEFTTAGVDGKPVKLSDYKGKYVMLDFWASWCAPCRAENPNVVKQYKIYHPQGLNILGLSLDVDKAKWQQAIAADGLSWVHGSDLKNFEGPVERLYHVEAIPANYIIDPKGMIIAKSITGPDLEEFLKKTFAKPQ